MEKSSNKILILTQAVDQNDQALSFFLDWLLEFSKRFDQVTVICLKKGNYNLPSNIKVLSLGKDEGGNILLQKFRYIYRFYKYIWSERKNYDSVFVHMNQIYVVMGGLFWQMQKKFVTLWYVHRQTSLSLYLATFFADKIFTSTVESFQINSSKRIFVGQAVNLEKFKRPLDLDQPAIFTLLTVGRITAIKNLDILIRAVKKLQDKHIFVKLNIIGEPVTDNDKALKHALHELVEKLGLKDVVNFLGSVPNFEIARHFWESSLTVNLCPTGGQDKAVLESLASGVPVVVSNISFTSLLGEYKEMFMFKERDTDSLVEKIEKYITLSEKEKNKIKNYLSDQVQTYSSLSNLHDIIFKTICHK